MHHLGRAIAGLLCLAGFTVAGIWLTRAAVETQPVVYTASAVAVPPRFSSAPLVILRPDKPPLQIGSVSKGSATTFDAALFGGAPEPGPALLLVDADLSIIWQLARDEDRALVLADAHGFIKSLAALASEVQASLLSDQPGTLDAVVRRLGDALAADPEAEQAARTLIDALGQSVASESMGLIGSFAGSVSKSAVSSVSGFFRSLTGASTPEQAPSALADPAVQARLSQIVKTFMADPRSAQAITTLAQRFFVVAAADPDLVKSVRRALATPAFRARAIQFGQEASALGFSSLTRILRLTAEPELNPVASALFNASLRRRAEPIAVALTAHERERLIVADPRLASFIYERSP